MRILNGLFALLLAIAGSSGCTSSAQLYDRRAPTEVRDQQIRSTSHTLEIPPGHSSEAEAAPGATDQVESTEQIQSAVSQEAGPTVAQPPETGSARVEERAASPAPDNFGPTSSQLASDHRKADQRWLELLEKDLDVAMEQIPERRRIQFSTKVVDHPRVRHFLKRYSTDAKHHFKELLTRSGKYMPMIARVLNEERLPPELGYLAFIESAFVVNTASPNGAVGLWQMIASTARKYGLRIDRWVDERRDPVKSTRAAAAYLKDLHDYYGRWFLATAAYNAGPGNIDKALRQSNAKDFWSIKAKLSDETRNFVPKFVAVSLIANDPHSYGFQEVRYQPPMDYEEVEVRGPMPLAALAQLSETAVSEIRRLNPALLGDFTPPGEKGYRIKLPAEKAAIFLANRGKKFAKVDLRQRRIVTHVVRKGETLSSIARFYGLTVRALMNFNGLTSSRLRIGQKLEILLAGLRRTLR